MQRLAARPTHGQGNLGDLEEHVADLLELSFCHRTPTRMEFRSLFYRDFLFLIDLGSSIWVYLFYRRSHDQRNLSNLSG